MFVEILKMTLPGILGLYAESNYAKASLPNFYSASSILSFAPRGYGAVLLVNVAASSIVLQILGGKVGAARKRFKEKALKNGDADAEERFSYPKLYAEGFSKEAKDFNCVQRGHQQALETYSQFVFLSLIAGLKYPVVSTVAGIIWIVARFKWAEGYATGQPDKRYESFFAKGIWIALIMQLTAAVATILSIADLI